MNPQLMIIKKAKDFVKDKTQETTAQELVSTLLERIKKERKEKRSKKELQDLIDQLQIAMGT